VDIGHWTLDTAHWTSAIGLCTIFAMTFEERPENFYLGKKYDLANHKLLEEPLQYDARDLTTHAVIIGMTGSGGTGKTRALGEVPEGLVLMCSVACGSIVGKTPSKDGSIARMRSLSGGWVSSK